MYIKISEDKAVKTEMEKPLHPLLMDEYLSNLLTLPTFEVPESMKSLPVGSELNVREQYEVYKTHFTNDGWNVCDKERYDLELPEARRIILVPCEQGEESESDKKYGKYLDDGHNIRVKAPERGEAKTIDYIHKGIEFSKKDGLITTPESYRLGAGYGYSCGYQDGVNSVLLPTPQPKGMTDYETALKWYAKGKDSSPELEKTEFNSFYSHLFNPNGTLK